jgi:hypothetical protein
MGGQIPVLLVFGLGEACGLYEVPPKCALSYSGD